MTQTLTQHKVTNPSENTTGPTLLRARKPKVPLQPGQLDPDISQAAGPSGAAHAQGQRQLSGVTRQGSWLLCVTSPSCRPAQNRVGCGLGLSTFS